MTRTRQVQLTVENYFWRGAEKKNVRTYFTVAGGGQGSAGQNTGQAFINLADYDKRSGSKNSADAIVQRASGAFRGLRDAQVFALVPGAIRGLGQSSGFTMEMLNTGGMSQEQFEAARDRLLAAASANPKLSQVRLSELPDVASLKVNIDQQRVAALGLSSADVNNTLSTAWGGRYVNDFIDRGRVKRVYVQGDAQYRSEPTDIDQWFVRNNQGSMVPFSSFAETSWITTPTSSSRFLGYPSFELSGQGAPGVSSGDAMNEVEEMVAKLPPGFGIEWTGQSYQERASGAQTPLLYTLSVIVVFLCLAALYESWSIPTAVLLVVPLGVLGAVLFTMLRGLQRDIYFQVAMLATVGLSSKNAILIVEFAKEYTEKGLGLIEATLHAVRDRLRPILMTSLAFGLGVLPLALASGAGSGAQRAIGTGVLGGMVAGTFLGIFFIPLFFVTVRKLFGRRRAEAPLEAETQPGVAA